MTRATRRSAAWLAGLALAAGCASEPAGPRAAPGAEPAPDAGAPGPSREETPPGGTPPGLVALAPGLRADVRAGVVEFDGVVAVDAHDPRTPDVYLELLVCSPDTREHESLVVTPVTPGLIHAALLAAGFTPGSPGRVAQLADGSVDRTPPTGDPVLVRFIVPGPGGDDAAHDPASWVTRAGGGAAPAWGGMVFSGSRLVERAGRTVYDADGTGVIVGLTTFGSEVVAPVRAVSPDSWVDEPAWVADARTIPARGTPVRVRLSRPDQ